MPTLIRRSEAERCVIERERHSMDPYAEFKRAFDVDGFVVQRGFVSPNVAAALRALAVNDAAIQGNSHAVLDAAGLESRLTLWYAPGDDAFGQLSCCVEMTETMAALLGGPVSFFHAKVMQKLPFSGGRWEWHQDYGYWYSDGFLKPDMGSCFVALEPATSDNGCLQVIPGSQAYGRVDHATIGEQSGADPDRVRAMIERLGTVACELDAGDALFFHANLLHCSGANESDRSRLGLISSFFTCDNESIRDDPRFKNKVYRQTRLCDLSFDRPVSEALPFLGTSSDLT